LQDANEPVGPATVESLAGQLRELGVESGDVLVVHSSLRSLGFVVGGAQAVIDALLEVMGPTGTLTMPSHSGDWTDPARWENPPVPESWWPVIAAECPPYDPYATPMYRMGAIPQALLARREVVRSAHPSVSHMALGPQASAICGSHPLDHGFGESSPLARLYELDAKVLLLGVGHDSNTSLHLAEHRASWPSKQTITQHSAVLVDGERRWVEYTELDGDTDDFAALGAEFESTGQVRIGSVGAATARLMRQREVVDFATDWLGRNRT
jgi:aminoglycoside 3-N-acetyltransferase